MRVHPLLRRGLARSRLAILPFALLLLTLPGAAALAACGEDAVQLDVKLTAQSGDTVKPGDTVTYVLQVVNNGPGSATNVHLALELPADFHYSSTPAIDHDIIGAPRLSVTDPQPKAVNPSWGTWNLAAPTTNADGTDRLSNVAVTFTVSAGGNPGDYALQPHAGSDQDADVAGAPLSVHLDAAPQLQVDVSSDRQTVTRNSDVLYRVTIENMGTGPASGIQVLVTLPDGLPFAKTDQISGNASRNNGAEPVVGTLEGYYSGFTIPPRSDAAPGKLVIVIRAHCAFCVNGTYTVTVEVSDDRGDVQNVSNAAPVQVVGAAPLPAVSPEPGAQPRPTTAPAPSTTPTASPAP